MSWETVLDWLAGFFRGLWAALTEDRRVQIGVIAVTVLLLLFYRRATRDRRRERRALAAEEQRILAVRALAENSGALSPEELLALDRSEPDFTGVYIVYNADRNMYYVGQAKSVLKRLNQHFQGHGNGDVYADYVHGDRFRIRALSLVESGYELLDELERDMIEAYDAYESGYNGTRGNER